MRKGDEREKWEKKIVTEMVVTRVVSSQSPKPQATALLIARTDYEKK